MEYLYLQPNSNIAVNQVEDTRHLTTHEIYK